MADRDWKHTACILCAANCGIEVALGEAADSRRFVRIRGDKHHPGSRGYTCEKGLRLDHYQNDVGRLTSPMRRRADGSFEAIDWDTAIAEVAARFGEIIDRHGGERILFYGGGGQGNHLGGGYGSATRAALGIRYVSNALAQEKTGEFWVDGQLFGRSRCHTTGDYERAQVMVFWGKNPWQSHGFPEARRVLKAAAADPSRTVVVVDPRRSETAELADLHLRPRPGGDAFVLAALVSLVAERYCQRAWVEAHCTGADEIRAAVAGIDVAEYCRRGGVDETDVRRLAELIGTATGGVSIYEDLGIQMAPHSTLNSYLEKLIVVLTGNLGVPGGMNLHSRFASLGGGGSGGRSGADEPRTPVTGHRLVTGLVPCNVIPDEILGEHPDRFRALLVESGNPAHSLADSQRMRAAIEATELCVVIDVAMTETARLADYVLPAASQFEKWECTFFNLEFPRNVFHARRPVLDPLPGTLPEAEIHARLCRALGAVTDDDLAPLHHAAAGGPDAYAAALFEAVVERPQLGKLLPVVLYETLGPTLRCADGTDAQQASALWGLAQLCAAQFGPSIRRAGIGGGVADEALGQALFQAIIDHPAGVVFTVDDYPETLRRVEHDDGRIHLAIPVLLDELRALAGEHPPGPDDAFPVVLSAGERRSGTANTIMRDPSWRRTDPHGALRVSPADAARYGLRDGGRARVITRRGSAVAVVEVNEAMREGHVSLPNGYGLGPTGDTVGVAPNELTASEDRDWFAGTPFHKHVPARLEPVG